MTVSLIAATRLPRSKLDVFTVFSVSISKLDNLFCCCCCRIYSEDLYNPRCLLLNIGCLLELNKEVALQELSHKLVEVYPENPVNRA